MDIKTLKDRWKRIISDSPNFDGDLQSLSVRIGRSPSYLRGMLRNNSAPGVDVLSALSDELKVPITDLLGADTDFIHLSPESMADTITDEIWPIVFRNLTKQSTRPSGRDMMLWWRSNNGRLEQFERFGDVIDLYETPCTDAPKISVRSLGAGSLVTASLGVQSPELLQKTLDPLGPEFSNRILLAHRNTLQEGPTTTIEQLDVMHPNGDNRITIEYIRTLLPVTLPDRSTCILTYAELLGSDSIVSSDIGQIGSTAKDKTL